MTHDFPPGWYADPHDVTRWRWWDGQQWTNHTAETTEAVEPHEGDGASAGVPAPEDGPPAKRTIGETRLGGDTSTPGAANVSEGRFDQSADRTKYLGMAGLAVAIVTLAAVGVWALLDRLGDEISIAEPAATLTPSPPTPDAPRTPEEPESEAADLRSLDWSDQSWTTDCTAHGDVETVRLEPGEDFDGEPVLERFDDEYMVLYSVHVEEVVYGDVTGDGNDDAIFHASCTHGNHYVQVVEVWAVSEEGEPTQLPRVLWYTRGDGLIDDFEVVDGHLRIYTSEPASWERAPHLYGYAVEVVTDWTYQRENWVAHEVSRSQEPPPVEIRGDGLGGVSFGDNVDAARMRLTDFLGEPDEDSGWVDPNTYHGTFGFCPGEAVRGVRWGTLLVLFVQGAEAPTPNGFFEYRYWDWEDSPDQHGFTTSEGVGVGAPLDELVEAHPNVQLYDEGTFGTFFSVPSNEGSFGGVAHDGYVRVFWAAPGDGCSE